MKRIIFSLFSLLLLGSSAKAAEGFSVKSVSLPINGQAELQVAYNFDTRTCRGIEFYLHLPSELDFVMKSSKVDYMQGFYNAEGTYTVAKEEDGSLHVLWAGTSNIPIHRKEGIIIAVKVKAKNGATINVGQELEGSIKNGVIGDKELSDYNFTVTIAESNPANYVLVDENSLFNPTTGKSKNVLVKRTLKGSSDKDIWNTICLPFAMDEDQLKEAFGDDVQVAEFCGWSYDDVEESIIINFQSVNEIESGYPYIIKVSSGIQQFNVDGVQVGNKSYSQDVEDTEGKGYSGSMTGNLTYTTMNENDLFLQDNMFYYSIQGQTIKGLRAIFNFYDQGYNPILISNNAASRGMFLVDGKPIGGIDDGTTTISSNRIISENKRVYSVTGRFIGEDVDMKSLPKGIYIVDGVKIIND